MDAEEKLMKAVVLLGPDSFEIQNVPIPVPEDDEVLCRIRAVAICGSDPHMIHGETAGVWPPRYPFIIGHEWSGEVVQVGKNVKAFKPGQRVAGEAHCGCGVCLECKKGNYNLCLNYGKRAMGHRHYGHNTQGSYAQYAVYGERSLTTIPAGVTFSQAAIVDAAGTGFQAIKLVGITPGGTSLIIGPGPIGLITAKLAVAMGSARVIVAGRGSRLNYAREQGFETVDIQGAADLVSAVRSLTNDAGVDEVFECSGAKGTIGQAVAMAKKGGKIALVGIAPPGRLDDIDLRTLVLNQITVQGCRANPNVSAPFMAMLQSGRIEVDSLITHHFKLEDFAIALDAFLGRKDGAMKVIIMPNGGID